MGRAYCCCLLPSLDSRSASLLSPTLQREGIYRKVTNVPLLSRSKLLSDVVEDFPSCWQGTLQDGLASVKKAMLAFFPQSGPHCEEKSVGLDSVVCGAMPSGHTHFNGAAIRELDKDPTSSTFAASFIGPSECALAQVADG